MQTHLAKTASHWLPGSAGTSNLVSNGNSKEEKKTLKFHKTERILIFMSQRTIGSSILLALIFLRYVCDSKPMFIVLFDLVNTIASFPRRMDPDLNPLPY